MSLQSEENIFSGIIKFISVDNYIFFLLLQIFPSSLPNGPYSGGGPPTSSSQGQPPQSASSPRPSPSLSRRQKTKPYPQPPCRTSSIAQVRGSSSKLCSVTDYSRFNHEWLPGTSNSAYQLIALHVLSDSSILWARKFLVVFTHSKTKSLIQVCCHVWIDFSVVPSNSYTHGRYVMCVQCDSTV